MVSNSLDLLISNVAFKCAHILTLPLGFTTGTMGVPQSHCSTLVIIPAFSSISSSSFISGSKAYGTCRGFMKVG